MAQIIEGVAKLVAERSCRLIRRDEDHGTARIGVRCGFDDGACGVPAVPTFDRVVVFNDFDDSWFDMGVELIDDVQFRGDDRRSRRAARDSGELNALPGAVTVARRCGRLPPP